MNNISSNIPDKRGMVLTDNVNLAWIASLSPQFFARKKMVKFVVDLERNKVAVGMQLHASATINDGSNNIFGGNIFFDDGHVEYVSTLNGKFNDTLANPPENNRKIEDKDMIERINNVLFAWVDGVWDGNDRNDTD